jgi:hypothetical protein
MEGFRAYGYYVAVALAFGGLAIGNKVLAVVGAALLLIFLAPHIQNGVLRLIAKLRWRS